MGCGVLDLCEGEVGAYGRGFEDVEGMKVDLYLMLWRRIERGGKIIKASFFFFLCIF